jgi:hypothetical protein
MNDAGIIRRGRSKRGAVILAMSLTLTLISAIGAVLMMRTLLDQTRINERRRDLWRAYLHAESGIAQLQHWGVSPSDFTLDTELFVEVRPEGLTAPELLQIEDESRYPAIAALPSGGIVATESHLDAMNVTPFVSNEGWQLGRISQISILPIEDDDHAVLDGKISKSSSAENYAFFKIISRGVSMSGLTRQLEAYLKPSPILIVASPGPMMSLSTAVAFGNAKIHWGEAWSRNDFDVISNSQLQYVMDDPLIAWRTEAHFNFDSTWKTNGTYQANRLYSLTADRPGLYPSGDGDWKDVFHQNVAADSLPFPDFGGKYEEFKTLAQANNRYFTTDVDGKIYRNGIEIDFYQAFTSTDPEPPFELAFIDTLDQQPPLPDGSNLATVDIQGNNGVGDRIRGFFYFCANFELGGVGSPASYTTTNPLTGAPITIPKIWLAGLLYSAGTADMDGNAGVYGAMVAEKGFAGGGTPDIYFNQGLKDGMEIENGNIGGPFTVVHSENYSVGP